MDLRELLGLRGVGYPVAQATMFACQSISKQTSDTVYQTPMNDIPDTADAVWESVGDAPLEQHVVDELAVVEERGDGALPTAAVSGRCRASRSVVSQVEGQGV